MGAGNSETNIDPTDHLSLTDQLAVYLAGEKAGMLFECPLPSWTACGDRAKVLTLLMGRLEQEDRKLRGLGYVRAHELLVEHKNKVIRLAQRLVEAHQVEAAEFMRLVNA